MSRIAAAIVCSLVGFCVAIAFGQVSASEGAMIGPGDLLQIRVAHAPEISEKPARVDAQGFVTLPMVGHVTAAGTVNRLSSDLRERLRPYLKNPEVSIEVLETKSKPVSVLGAVKTPGNYQIVGKPRLLDVLTQAGGLDADAGYSIRVSRAGDSAAFPPSVPMSVPAKGYSVAEISISGLMTATHPEQNIAIQPDDVITVPRAQLIYIVGEVRRAGGFPLRERESLSVLKALSLAEGLTTTAAGARAKILRGPAGDREEIAVNVGRILAGKDADQLMRPEDVLFIPSSAGKKVWSRSLETALQMGTGIVIWRR